MSAISATSIPTIYRKFTDGILLDHCDFIFEIIGEGEFNLDKINHEQYSIAKRIAEINATGFKIIFHKISPQILQLNLEVVDSEMPKLLAHLLLKYCESQTDLPFANLLARLINSNPLGYNLSYGHPIYECKIKDLLFSLVSGMNAVETWDGKCSSAYGIVLSHANGDITCYHIHSTNTFLNYLLDNTTIERSINDGYLYKEGSKVYFKLNLQIRFLK